MKKFILSLAVVALAWGCATDGTEDIKQLAGDKTVIEAELASVRTHIAEDGFKVLWSKGDKIGVVLADNSIVPFTLQDAYAGKAVGCFEGTLAAGAEVKTAIYPYSASGVTIAREQSVASTSTEIGSGDVAVATYENGKLNFTSKVALLAVSFKNIDGSAIAGKKIQTVKVTGNQKDYSGGFTYNTDDVTAALTKGATYPEVSLKFTDEPTLSADVKGYLAVNPIIAQNDEISIFVKAADEWYQYNTVVKTAMVAGTRYNLPIDAAQLKKTIHVDWSCYIGGYCKGSVPAIDDNGNVYLSISVDSKVYKINNSGTKAWGVSPGYDKGDRQGVSVAIEADGSCVYTADHGSTVAKRGLYILNGSDGSVKGTFLNEKFYNKGNTPSININAHTTPAYDANYIYIGNGGSTGTVCVVNKSDYSRKAYIGTGATANGPAGGCASPFAFSSTGTFMFGAGYGSFIVDKNALINSTTGYADVIRRIEATSAKGGYVQGAVVTKINGVEHFVYHKYDESSGKENYIVAYKADGSNGTATFRHQVADKPNATLQDQGGLIVGTNGEVIVPLKHKTGLKGGLYAVGTDGALAWEYRTGTGVSGAAALDNAGNIHFADESGFYYIIKPDYAKKSATLVLKVRTVDLMRNAGVDIAENYSKVWSSVMLDKSGKIYLATNLSNQCYVLRMSYHGTTGMGTSMWPVKFGNQYHSGQPNIAK